MEPYLTQPQLLRGVRDWFAIKKYWMKWRTLGLWLAFRLALILFGLALRQSSRSLEQVLGLALSSLRLAI